MKRSMVFEGVAVTLLILLAFLMLAMVMGGSPGSQVSGTGGYTYTYAGPDNMLYVFSAGHIQAIDASGGQAWDFSVPDGWEVCYKWLPVQISEDGRYTITDMGPIASSYNGTLYWENYTTNWMSRQSVQDYYYSKSVEGFTLPVYDDGVIYAFDNNGTLLWYKPTGQLARSMQVTPNGTIFYQMPDGKIRVTNTGLAAGFTFTAVLYLLIRFVCLGAVARAKARLSKNENRNRILDFIVKNPGSSLYEITRGTGVNLGTVRYHLFILGMNHKIAASQTDGKYVRYFTNSGSYSKDEQLILSLMRRDAMGRVLGLMLEKPGIPNAEIARKLDIRESVVSRCVKELAEKGVIAKEPAGRGCSVDESHREHVLAAMRRIYGE